MSNIRIMDRANKSLIFSHNEGYGVTQYFYFKRLTDRHIQHFIGIMEKDLTPLKTIDADWPIIHWKLIHLVIKIISYTRYFDNISYLLAPGVNLEYDYFQYTHDRELFASEHTKAELITPQVIKKLLPKTIEEMDAFRKVHASSFKILDEIHIKMGLLQHE